MSRAVSLPCRIYVLMESAWSMSQGEAALDDCGVQTHSTSQSPRTREQLQNLSPILCLQTRSMKMSHYLVKKHNQSITGNQTEMLIGATPHEQSYSHLRPFSVTFNGWWLSNLWCGTCLKSPDRSMRQDFTSSAWSHQNQKKGVRVKLGLTLTLTHFQKMLPVQ